VRKIVLDQLLMSPAEHLQSAETLARCATSLQMPRVFVRKGSARYLQDVEPMVLFSVQLATPATRRIVKTRGLASGRIDDAMRVKLLRRDNAYRKSLRKLKYHVGCKKMKKNLRVSF